MVKLKTNKITMLAQEIDEFLRDYDPYDYDDRVPNREEAIEELSEKLKNGEAEDIRDYLETLIEDSSPILDATLIRQANVLLSRLDIRECPVCKNSVERPDMYYTKDCHGIPMRLVCVDCYSKIMSSGYDGQYYTEADECLDYY